eukprot:138075-Chlamydomonas_euryale.AAC.1
MGAPASTPKRENSASSISTVTPSWGRFLQNTPTGGALVAAPSAAGGARSGLATEPFAAGWAASAAPPPGA